MIAGIVAWIATAALVVAGGVYLVRTMPPEPPAGPEREDLPLADHERAVQQECGELLRRLTREGAALLARERKGVL